jgi:hypothetical protein
MVPHSCRMDVLVVTSITARALAYPPLDPTDVDDLLCTLHLTLAMVLSEDDAMRTQPMLTVVVLTVGLLCGGLTVPACAGEPPEAAMPHGPAFTATALVERTLHRRAVEAAIWGMPLVNFDAMRQAYFRDAGAKYNDVMYWSKPSDWKNQTTTPNHSTNYVLFFLNLKDGPVVVDIPAAQEAALYGTLINAWTEPLVNVGNTGEDRGQGAKYLLLPPGSTETPPAGYVPVPSVTYNGYSLLRVITKTHRAADLHQGLAYLQRLKVYPLANAASPPATRFIDIADQVFDGIPVFDASFYTALARMVAEEPVLERDLAIMGQWRSLNIGQGLTFQPDAARTALLNRAIAEAHAVMMEGFATTGDVVWQGQRKWRRPAEVALAHGTKLTFVEPGRGIRLDERGYAWFAMYGPVVPPPPQL